jgi:hypothetical protein
MASTRSIVGLEKNTDKEKEMEDQQVYGDSKMKSTSKSSKPQKFFERQIDMNNLEELEKVLHVTYDRIKNGELISGPKNENTPWDNSGSVTTVNWNKYNVFQIYDENIHTLFRAVRDMAQDACEYYELDFIKEQFMVQGWFNINYNHVGKLDWHEHGGDGAPHFHGYYCVNAEPSITHYRVFDEEIENVNKNNRAILSETGHPHAMGDWDWEGPRVTMAYDVIPLRFIPKEWEQHWIPLV